jgi:signal transduction protein with GAF and PtsI domain
MMDHRTLTLERLRQQLSDQTRKLSALHDILEAVSAPVELPVVLKKSLRAALVAAQGKAGFIHLRDKSGRTMRLAAREGIPDSVIGTIASISSEDGLVAWVARNKESLIVPNIGEDSGVL